MRRTIFLVALIASTFVMKSQKSSLGVTFSGSLDVANAVSVPSDFYFNPNMQVGVTGKTIFFDRLTLEGSLLYGIRQLNFFVLISDSGIPYNDQSYCSSLAFAPLVGFRLFEIGSHNLNIGVGAEPAVYFPHAASIDGIGKYKNNFDMPVLARLTYGVSGIDIAVTYKHSFMKQYNASFNDSKARELMFSVYLPLWKI